MGFEDVRGWIGRDFYCSGREDVAVDEDILVGGAAAFGGDNVGKI